MMLTPEQLAEWRDYVRTAKDTLVPMTKYELCSVLNHIDAQQARIAELEENAQAHKLAMQAGKSMLQAETERADKAEAHLQLANDCQEPLFDELTEKTTSIAELEAKWLAEREAYLQERDKCEQLEQKLRGIANYLRNAGATIPAPPAAGTIESAMNHGLCIALLVVEEAMQSTWPEDASDYGSRIDVLGQNGNDGLHYPEGTP